MRRGASPGDAAEAGPSCHRRSEIVPEVSATIDKIAPLWNRQRLVFSRTGAETRNISSLHPGVKAAVSPTVATATGNGVKVELAPTHSMRVGASGSCRPALASTRPCRPRTLRPAPSGQDAPYEHQTRSARLCPQAQGPKGRAIFQHVDGMNDETLSCLRKVQMPWSAGISARVSATACRTRPGNFLFVQWCVGGPNSETEVMSSSCSCLWLPSEVISARIS